MIRKILKVTFIAALVFNLSACADWFANKARPRSGPPALGNHVFTSTDVPMGILNSIQAPAHFARTVGITFIPKTLFGTPSNLVIAYGRVRSVLPAFGRVNELNSNVMFAYMSIATTACNELVSASSPVPRFWVETGINQSITSGSAASMSQSEMAQFVQALALRAWGEASSEDLASVRTFANDTRADFDTRFGATGRREWLKSVCVMVLLAPGSIGV